MNKRFIDEEEVKEIVFMKTGSEIYDIQDYVCERFFYISSESNVDKESTIEKSIVAYKVSYSDSNGVYSFVINCETGEIIEYNRLLNGESIPQINFS